MKVTTLYLDRKGLEVKLDGSTLALYEQGTRLRTVPLSLLDRVVIRAETVLTSGVLGAVAEAGISAVVFSGRRGTRLALVQGRPHNDAALRLAQYAKSLDPDWRLDWSRRLVSAKLLREQRLLQKALSMRPDRRKPIYDALATLRPLQERVQEEGGSLDTLRGLEGAGQAAYLRAFTSLFPPSLGFRSRNRRPPRDPVNACLSLGYTLVHFEAVRAAYAAGLDPFLGFFHEPAFGRESLACDLMEPLRPQVDDWVWKQFRSRVLRREHFLVDKGRCLLGKRGRFRFYEGFEELLGSAAGRLRGYCRFLVRSLRSQAPPLPRAQDEDA